MTGPDQADHQSEDARERSIHGMVVKVGAGLFVWGVVLAIVMWISESWNLNDGILGSLPAILVITGVVCVAKYGSQIVVDDVSDAVDARRAARDEGEDPASAVPNDPY